MKRHWYMQFDVARWLADTRISSLSIASRAIYLDLKARMFEQDRCGLVAGTPEILSRLCRCTSDQLTCALSETAKSLFEVAERDGLITVVDLEMRKEYNIRKNRELRNKRYRSKFPIETDSETPQKPPKSYCSFNSDTSSEGSGEVKTRDDPAAQFFEAWNAIDGVAACREMTKERRKKLATRLESKVWAADWRAGLEKIAGSSFCKGGGPRGWRADVDWFLRPDTLTRLLEGKFDDQVPVHENGEPELPIYVAPGRRL